MEEVLKQKIYLLINCLNMNGASAEFIKCRISCFKAMETMNQIANLGKGGMDGYFLGSQIEGGALLGLDSDEDLMLVNADITVLADFKDYKPKQPSEEVVYRRSPTADQEHETLQRTCGKPDMPLGLISEEGVTPGYVNIIAINKETGKPLTEEEENPLSHLCDVDDNGHMLFSIEKLQNRMEDATTSRYKHGPAMTEDSTKEFKTSDLVYGLQTSSWPKSAEEWKSRERRYKWPHERTLKLVKDGCFLVPVSSSHTSPPTEWRLSFTLLERELIWTWNVIQYKCFMLLKIIKRDLIEPKVPNSITSYHLKTLMFWLSEERDPTFWNIQNFPNCIRQCLEKLLKFICDEHCPQYFIRTNNLLKGKLSLEAKEKVVSILTDFMDKFWSDVFELTSLSDVSQSIEQGLTECFVDLQSAALRNPILLNEIVNLRISALISFATSAMKPAFQLLVDGDVNVAIGKHTEYLRLLSSLHSNDEEHLKLVNALHRLVDISLGSQLCSSSCCVEDEQDKLDLRQKSESLLKRGESLDTSSGKLKLATLYFVQGKFQQALNCIHGTQSKEDVLPLCGFEPRNPDNVSLELAIGVIIRNEDLVSLLRDHGALEIVFLPSEIYSAPDSIKFEINRAMIAEKDHGIDHPLRWVALDSKFYALLLEFHILHKQKSFLERDKTLTELRKYVKTPGRSVLRSVTALNIVGHCFAVVGDLQWAVDVFMGSLILHNSHNAAAWHLALITWKQLNRL